MKKHTHLGKKFVSIMSVLLCLVMVFGTVACTPRGDDTDKTKVNISLLASKDGFGLRGLEIQAERFNEAFKNKVYTNPTTGETLTGVVLKIFGEEHSPSPGPAWLEDPYTMYNARTDYASLESAYHNGWAANIDSILRSTIPGETETVLDKFPEEIKYKYRVTTENGNADGYDYCGFPYNETANGIIYDVDLWDKGYYIASPDATDTESYFSSIVDDFSLELVDKDGDKSVGPNGIAGDYDDGLPSSMLEFIVVCEKIAEDGVSPFAYTGEYPTYFNLGLGALMFSLLGENAKAMIEFESDSFNVVTGFESTGSVFSETLSDIDCKIPVVTQVEMIESCGYYTSMALEKYWVYAFTDLADAMGWFNYSARMNRSHIETQKDFIFGIEPDKSEQGAAMLCEGSYWFNESIDEGNFDDYEKNYLKKADDRNVAWMPLPVNIYTSVTGENGFVEINGVKESTKGENPTLDIVGGGSFMVNAKYEDDPMIMEAVKDYILFVTSDVELNKFAADTGYSKMLNFDYDDEIMADAPKYVQSTFKLFNTANKVREFSTAKTYQEKTAFTFMRSYDSYYFQPQQVYKAGGRGYISQGATAKFIERITDREGWWSIFVGEDEATPPTWYNYPADYPVVELRGQEVKFQK